MRYSWLAPILIVLGCGSCRRTKTASPPEHSCWTNANIPNGARQRTIEVPLTSLLPPRAHGEPPWVGSDFWKRNEREVTAVVCEDAEGKAHGPQRVYDPERRVYDTYRLLYEGTYERGRLVGTETFYTLDLVDWCGEEIVEWLGHRAVFKGKPCPPPKPFFETRQPPR